MKKEPLLSVITPTLNARRYIPSLIESLRSQSDQEFEWIVPDGGSTDGTLELLADVTDLDLKLDSCADFGIYDALNRAVKYCSADYYLVCGADDRLSEKAIQNYKKEILESRADIITAKILIQETVVGPKGSPWLYGMKAFISSHSVGAIFKKSLHEKYGYYSQLYPICSDKLFVERAIVAGVSVKKADFVAGTYSGDGVSSTNNVAATLCENFCIQIAIGRNKFIQLLLLCLRLIKNYRKI